MDQEPHISQLWVYDALCSYLCSDLQGLGMWLHAVHNWRNISTGTTIVLDGLVVRFQEKHAITVCVIRNGTLSDGYADIMCEPQITLTRKQFGDLVNVRIAGTTDLPHEVVVKDHQVFVQGKPLSAEATAGQSWFARAL